ncbi:sugar ABC transporter ATP-binding protein [Sodalis sp. RH16]|uniref:sugar ABC transporter ATP-binding protein n=1 Tax=Sodalis sp. RH16 TaxID=3394331 RepID=UPI0039B51729
MEHNLLAVNHLGKRYGRTLVLDDLSLLIPANKVVAVIGENGAGKSTLMDIISGIVPPTSGEMLARGRPYQPGNYRAALGEGVSRVFQEQSLVANVPVYENLLLGEEARFTRAGQWLDKRKMITAAEGIVEASGFDIDVRKRTGDYDFSKRQAIEIARACLTPSLLRGVSQPLILLDEPTSALDRRDEEIFFRLVAQVRLQGSLLFVSHRLSEVMSHADIICVLKDGRLVATLSPGETDESGLHRLMVGRERSADHYYQQRQEDVSANPIRLETRRLAQSESFQDVSLRVRAGEVLGIGGLLDSGKSALGKAVAGITPPDDGEVSLDGQSTRRPDIRRFIRQGLGYIPAERLTDGLIACFSVAWNFSLAGGGDLFAGRLGLWRLRREQRDVQRYIEQLRIRSATPVLACSRLSGGNQQKVVLARWLCRSPRVLVLDNPTRGVDAGSKEEIYRIIRELTQQGVAILLITDELLELIGLSNRILIMRRGRVVKELAAPPDQKPGERDIIPWMLPDGASRPDEPSAFPLQGAGYAN